MRGSWSWVLRSCGLAVETEGPRPEDLEAHWLTARNVQRHSPCPPTTSCPSARSRRGSRSRSCRSGRCTIRRAARQFAVDDPNGPRLAALGGGALGHGRLGSTLSGLAAGSVLFQEAAIHRADLLGLGHERKAALGTISTPRVLLDAEGQGGRHPRQEFQPRVGRLHDDRVGHHVLDGGRVETDLGDPRPGTCPWGRRRP